MKRYYTEPRCEIVRLYLKDIIVTSDPVTPNDVTPEAEETTLVTDGAGAVFTKAAYMNNVVHGAAVDHGDLYDPFYSAPHTLSAAAHDQYSGYNSDTDAGDDDSDIEDVL